MTAQQLGRTRAAILNCSDVWAKSFQLGLYDMLMPINFDRSIRGTFDMLAAPHGTHILELGIGSGRSLEHAAEWLRMGGRLTAVDILASGLQSARIRARRLGVEDRITFVQADIRKLSEAIGPGFHGAYSHFVLYTLADASDRIVALSELAKVLVPGARVAITVPSEDYSAKAFIDEARAMEWARPDTTLVEKWVRSRLLYGLAEKSTKRVVEDAMVRGKLHRYSAQDLCDELIAAGFDIEAINRIRGLNSYQVRALRRTAVQEAES